MLGKANLLKRLTLVFLLAGFSAQVAQAALTAKLIYLMNGQPVTQVEAGNNVFVIAKDLGRNSCMDIVWADNPSIEITGTGAHSFPATSMTRYSSDSLGEIYYYSWIINDGAIGIQTFTLTHQGTDTVETTSNTITVIGITPVTTPTINTQTSNDPTPVITGTTGTGSALLTGETLSITLNGTTYTPTVATDGTWSFTANTLADGTYNITATFTNATGNVSTDTTSNELTVDNTAPTLTSFTPANNATNVPLDSNIVLTFNEEITIGTGNITLAPQGGTAINIPITSTQVTGEGTNKITIDPTNILLANTSYSITAPNTAFTDSAGNAYAGISISITTITTDTTAPEATLIYLMNGQPVTQVEAGNTAFVIATDLGGIVWADSPSIEITGTGAHSFPATSMMRYSSDSLGELYYYSWTINDGAVGIQTFTLTHQGTDTVETTSNTITVIGTAPVTTPTINTLTSNDTTPVITGTTGTGNSLLTGETLSITLNGETYTPTVATDGTWSFTANTLADGTYDITATVTDTAGNVSTDTTSNELIIDTTAPATPTVNTLTSNDTTPEITGTTGTGNSLLTGETLSVALNGETYTPTVATDGTWSFTVSNANALTSGTYEVVATFTDAAGNISTDTTSNELTVDTIAPATPTVNAQTSNNSTPVITGTTGTGSALLTGETLSVALNGETYTATVATDGTWHFTANTLADGTYDITATATDTAGNVSTDTTSNELTVDTTAPVTTPTVNAQTSNDTTPIITGTTGTGSALTTGETLSVALDGTSYTPTVATDGTWSFTVSNANALTSGTYEVVATFTDATGNISTDTTSNELTIDTTAPTADVHAYLSINGISYGLTEFSKVKAGDVIIINAEFNKDIADSPPIQITGTGVNFIATTDMIRYSNRTFRYFWTVGTGDGTQTFRLSQGTDLAGNVITPASATITVDNIAPATPTVNAQTSNDTTPVITGTTGTGIALTTGETLSVALDGTSYTPTVATDGTWSFTANTPLVDGTYNVIATITNAAGNISTDTTTNELTIKDTIAPTADVRSYKRINGISYGFTEVKAGDVIIVNATFSEDIADTPAMQITGTGVDPTATTNMTKFNATTYYYFWTVGDAHGEQKFILSQGTDLAGNVMEPTSSVTITVNNNAAKSTPTVNTQETNDPTPTITGTTGTGTALSSSETLSVEIYSVSYTPTVATDGTWSLTANTLADGTYDITATITDAAGDTGADTTTNELMIDTIAPTLVSHSPADGATGVAAFNNIVLIFDEPVAKGSGNVHIIHSSRREVNLKYPPTLEDLNASVRQITGYGTNTLTIDPLIPFDRQNGEYIQVNIQATAFDDLTGNSFGFTTFGFNSKKDTTNPTVGLRYFIDGPYGTPVSQVTAGDVVTVVATFSELVVDITEGSDGIKITGTGANNIPATNMAWADLDRWPYAYIQTFIYEWTVGTGGGIQAFTLSHAMDLFGNMVVSEPTSGATITVKDTTSPTAVLTYSVDDRAVTRVNVGDVVRITATFNEDMALFPTAQITGTGVDSIAAASMTRVINVRTYYYLWTAVNTDGGTQTFTLSRGTDLAGNVVVSEPTSGGTIEVYLNNCKSFAGRYDT